MSASQAAELALFEWVNAFAEPKADSLGDLVDGHALAQVLKNIDDSFDPSTLAKVTSSTPWVTKFHNLQLVEKSLVQYTNRSDVQFTAPINGANLEAIAREGDKEETIKLLTDLLMASISGPSLESNVVRIQQLSGTGQEKIAAIIMEKQNEVEAEQKSAHMSPPSTSASNHPTSIDTDLEFEEKLAYLAAQNAKLVEKNTRLEKQNADFTIRLGRLQDNNQTLQKELGEAQDQISGRNVTSDGSVENTIKRLENKVREQEELIASQEGQIESDRAAKESLSAQAKENKKKADSVEALKDSISELKHQNEELTKKANTAEKYKQKLETQRDLDTENQQLRSELNELSESMLDMQKLQTENASLREAQGVYYKRVEGYEIEIFELNRVKDTLKHEKAELQIRLTQAEEMKTHDTEYIRQLEDERATAASPTGSPTKASGGTLGAELEDFQEKETAASLELQISRLTSENQLLKANAASGQENIQLQLLLDEVNIKLKTMEEKYNRIYEDHVILQEQMRALVAESASEELVKIVDKAISYNKRFKILTNDFYRNEAFIALRTNNMRLIDENSNLNKEIREAKAENSRLSREVISLKADLDMVDKEELQMIDNVKSVNSTLLNSTKSDYERLQGRYKSLEMNSDLQKAQLTEALLSKDKLRQKMDEVEEIAEQRKKELDDLLAGNVPTKKSVEDPAKQNEDLKKRDLAIRELQEKLRAIENGEEAKQHKAALANLKRENDLIMTAWYDLTTRLQSNNVILQRRNDVPRSWINKQRHAVGSLPRR